MKKRCFKNQMSVITLEQLSVFLRLTLHLRLDDHDGIVTHGRSREFRMHMKNPAQTGSGCFRFKIQIIVPM
jgi:hypothetical protein